MSARDEPAWLVVFVWKRRIAHNFWRFSTCYSIVSSKGWKGRRCKELERHEKQNEAEHGESAIDGMHVLLFPLGSVDSVLYPVVAPVCKHRTLFFALPLRSRGSRHTLHVIKSREPTPINCQSSSIRIETASRGGLTQTGLKSVSLEPDSDVEGTNPVRSGLKPIWNRFTLLV